MSELTPCNYCSYERMKAMCKESGEKIRLKKPDDKEMADLMQWAVEIDGEEVAWFMELTDHCVC